MGPLPSTPKEILRLLSSPVSGVTGAAALQDGQLSAPDPVLSISLFFSLSVSPATLSPEVPAKACSNSCDFCHPAVPAFLSCTGRPPILEISKPHHSP